MGLKRLAIMICRRSINTALGGTTNSEQLVPRARAEEKVGKYEMNIMPVTALLSKVSVMVVPVSSQGWNRKQIG